jgi:CDP-paratose 2-epimerase
MRALAGQPITLYGDGLQVRDVLFVEDLIEAMLLAQGKMDTLRGQAFNIGGGPSHTTSLLELVQCIAALLGRSPELRFEEARVGDQRYYVSNIEKFKQATGWAPTTSLQDGLSRLHMYLLRASSESVQRLETARQVVGSGNQLIVEAH